MKSVVSTIKILINFSLVDYQMILTSLLTSLICLKTTNKMTNLERYKFSSFSFLIQDDFINFFCTSHRLSVS